MFDVDIDLTEFRRGKRQFDAETRRLMRDGVRTATQRGADHAKSAGKFEDRTGTLRRTIRATLPSSSDQAAWATIEAPETYASFVEEGTKPHWIRPIDYQDPGGARHTIGRNAGRFVRSPTYGAGRGQFLRFYVGGKAVFAREVYHPGSRAFPFMGPAYQFTESFLENYLVNGFIGIQARVWE